MRKDIKIGSHVKFKSVLPITNKWFDFYKSYAVDYGHVSKYEADKITEFTSELEGVVVDKLKAPFSKNEDTYSRVKIKLDLCGEEVVKNIMDVEKID